MASDERTGETTVTDRYSVTIPAPVRNRLDIQPGDTVRWTVTSDDALNVEVVKQRYGAFTDFEPIDMGPTNAGTDHDEVLAAEIDEEP